jgi:hypothetical protein
MARIYKKGIKSVYRGVTYRSRWEVYVSKLLLYSDIQFKYEPQRFFLTQTISYLPDFYIPTLGIYLEVKGSLSKKDRIIISLFSRTHKLIYLGKEELEYISGRKSSFLSSPEILLYSPTTEEVTRFRRVIEK